MNGLDILIYYFLIYFTFPNDKNRKNIILDFDQIQFVFNLTIYRFILPDYTNSAIDL